MRFPTASKYSKENCKLNPVSISMILILSQLPNTQKRIVRVTKDGDLTSFGYLVLKYSKENCKSPSHLILKTFSHHISKYSKEN